MSFLDRLKSAPLSPQAQFNVFLMSFRPQGRTIFAFVEGKDDLGFYGMMLSQQKPDNVDFQFIKCGNKDGIKSSLQQYESRFGPNPRALFFMDRDHDNIVPVPVPQSKYLFVTRWYSIESYLCDEEMVRRYLVESIGLDSGDPAVPESCNTFSDSWQSFVHAALTPMAWIIAARRSGGSLNLNNIDTKKVLMFDGTSLSVTLTASEAETIGYLESVTGGSSARPQTDPSLVASVKAELQQLEPLLWIRGKQVAWFMVTFLRTAVETLRQAGRQVKMKTNLHLDNAVEVLAPRLTCPKDIGLLMAQVSNELG